MNNNFTETKILTFDIFGTLLNLKDSMEPYLKKYLSLPETDLEIIESIDMNRILENGGIVRMVLTAHQTFAVDTPEDLEKVKKLL